ncbi:MAG: hypothetical protein B6D63_02490 [Candidatus Latescibacteria bacterium 4484_7]|nr:MAG: hypothetical protein B6D63_02490 [Candidatus Latescibacteria bacterium 4484_7]RKZ05859.1 MAG: hypothetical protein DRQ05_05735 [bacterium]
MVIEWRKIIPQIELIEEEDLRNKVIEVWNEAFKLGGWNEEELNELPFTLLVSDTPISLIDHTRLVTDIAIRVSESLKEEGGIELNRDYLIAGAILHDVGKLLEFGKSNEGIGVSYSGRLLRHPLSGLALAYKLGLPEEVCHIIALHSREGEGSYRNPEAIVLHHADFITFEIVKASMMNRSSQR